MAALHGHSHLKHLELVALGLTGVSIPTGLVSLSELVLRDNELPSLPINLSQLPALAVLNTSNQKVNFQLTGMLDFLVHMPRLSHVCLGTGAQYYNAESLFWLSNAHITLKQLRGQSAQLTW